MVKETEASLKDTYAKAPYKDELFNKLLELQEINRQRWAQDLKAKPQEIRSKAKDADPKPQVHLMSAGSTDLKVAQILHSQSEEVSVEAAIRAPQVFLEIKDSKELQGVISQVSSMKQQLSFLFIGIGALVLLNIILMGIVVSKMWLSLILNNYSNNHIISWVRQGTS